MTNQEYLESVVEELMEDPQWQLPPELRFFPKTDLEWTLLGL